jgi:hypothetical protein
LIVPLAMFGAVAVIGGGVVLANRMITRRRTRAYETLCMERGWQFDTERPGEEARHTAACRVFAEGHSHRWTFTIAGKTGGAPFTAFEYRWITGSGKNAQRHRISGLLWTLEHSIPQFFLTPERLWDRIAAHFGGQDIDFDESPGFSRAYRLRGADEAAVRALFTPTRRQRFEQFPDQRVSGAGSELVWWQNGALPAPDAIDDFLMRGERIRRVIADD